MSIAGIRLFNETVDLENMAGYTIMSQTPDGNEHYYHGFGLDMYVCITEDIEAFIADPTNSDYGLWFSTLCRSSQEYNAEEVNYLGVMGWNSRYSPTPLFFDKPVEIEGQTYDGWLAPFVRYIYITENQDIPEEYATEIEAWIRANTTDPTRETPTFDSIKAKIQLLIDKSNEKTGRNDTDLNSAFESLLSLI